MAAPHLAAHDCEASASEKGGGGVASRGEPGRRVGEAAPALPGDMLLLPKAGDGGSMRTPAEGCALLAARAGKARRAAP